MYQPSHFYRETAKKLEITEELSAKVNQYYWHYGVRKNLSEIKHQAIFLKNLGTIMVSRYKLREEITELIFRIRSTRKSTRLTEYSKNMLIEKHYGRLRRLLKRRNQIAIQFYKDDTKDKPSEL